ncbi:hypothetical protein Enr8_46310 [Blastopirellula retiformator]|uniref:Uncharacterized protein n=2 Tax=Blastopirellula retiformator TaxID=2527970 RepID=A0A5C5UU54_9BACT|nr:hypothetical protein Enr8_46310 [Blastopirellula retiformator]
MRLALEQEFGKGQVVVNELRDDSGVVVVLPMRDDGKSNAQIRNASGEVRCEIEIPASFRGGNGFADAYYVNGELTAIFVRPGRDFAFIVDEQTGRILKCYETR